jgi:DNA-directed RNA polymerase II subunit RPB1
VQDENRLRPRVGGLGDERMGSIDRNFECQSCKHSIQDCQGHFGHIELAMPVYHPGFIKKTKQLLECVCHNCGKILVDEVCLAYQSLFTDDADMNVVEQSSLCGRN